MYYRWEVRKSENEPWVDIFTIFDGYERNKILRVLPDPCWNANHPEVETEWWLTEYAFKKYKKVFDEIVNDMPKFHPKKEMQGLEIRVHEVPELDNIVYLGRTQVLTEVKGG